MVTAINGFKVEEFARNVADYLECQQDFKEAEQQFEIAKATLRSHMEDNDLTQMEIGTHVVTLKEITRKSVDSKIAEVVIPKKYLDQAIRSTTFTQLKVAVKKVIAKKD